MATRDVAVKKNVDGALLLAQWFLLGDGDDGEPLGYAAWGDRSVQVTGTFDGAELHWEGSNDGINYSPMVNVENTPIVFTATGLVTVLDIARYCRPRVVGGTGSTDLAVHVIVRRAMAVARVTEDADLSQV